jgi:hypothetical protein
LSLPGGWLPADADLFEAVGPRPSAAARESATATAVASALVADHQLQIRTGRELTGTSTFDLLPGGAPEVTLALPPGLRLIHVSVEGIPAQPVRQGGGQWSVAITGSRVPQRLTVVYAGALAARDGGRLATIAAPRLLDVPIGQTLWTVQGAELAESSPEADGDDTLPLVRLEAVAAAADELAHSSTTRDLSAAALRAVCEAWDDRCRDAQVQLPRELPPALADRAASARERLLTAREGLVDAGLLAEAEPTTARSPSERPSQLAGQLAVAGDDPSIEVLLPSEPMSAFDMRLVAAGGALAAGWCAWWLLAVGFGKAWLVRYAHFAAAAIGLIWLAVGPVPWLGGILVVLALWSVVRSPWPRPASQSTSSRIR